MNLQDYEISHLFKNYSYLQDNRFNIEAVYMNEVGNVLCVILELKKKDLMELVNNFGWKCIFDEKADEEQALSICITK